MQAESGQHEAGVETAPHEAVILQFPNSGEKADQMRLRRALAALDMAVAEQRRAVADWQASLAELSHAVGGLGDALQVQDRALGALAADVAGVNGQANRLLAWSDAALAAHG